MPTGIQGTQARSYGTHQVHYLRKDFTFADDGQTLSMGFVPAGAIVVARGCNVSEVFNGGSTNTVDIGTAADPDGFVDGMSLATVGLITAGSEMATSNDTGPYAEDTEIVCAVVATANASTGIAQAWVQFMIKDGV